MLEPGAVFPELNASHCLPSYAPKPPGQLSTSKTGPPFPPMLHPINAVAPAVRASVVVPPESFGDSNPPLVKLPTAKMEGVTTKATDNGMPSRKCRAKLHSICRG